VSAYDILILAAPNEPVAFRQFHCGRHLLLRLFDITAISCLKNLCRHNWQEALFALDRCGAFTISTSRSLPEGCAPGFRPSHRPASLKNLLSCHRNKDPLDLLHVIPQFLAYRTLTGYRSRPSTVVVRFMPRERWPLCSGHRPSKAVPCDLVPPGTDVEEIAGGHLSAYALLVPGTDLITFSTSVEIFSITSSFGQVP